MKKSELYTGKLKYSDRSLLSIIENMVSEEKAADIYTQSCLTNTPIIFNIPDSIYEYIDRMWF